MRKRLLISGCGIAMLALLSYGCKETPPKSPKTLALDKVDSLKKAYVKLDTTQAPEEQRIQTAMELMVAFREYEVAFPEDTNSEKFHFQRAQMYSQVLNDHWKAGDWLERFAETYRGSRRRPDALLMSAGEFSTAGDTLATLRVIDKILSQYKETPWAEQATQLRNLVQMDEKQMEQFLQKAVEKSEKSPS